MHKQLYFWVKIMNNNSSHNDFDLIRVRALKEAFPDADIDLMRFDKEHVSWDLLDSASKHTHIFWHLWKKTSEKERMDKKIFEAMLLFI